jgi:ribonucleoside-diphosphate reductase alpha chain
LDKENRRETWDETVSRYTDFWWTKYMYFDDEGNPQCDLEEDLYEIHKAILNHEVMPSMRALMTAGPALERCNSVGYNCAAVAVNHPRVFDEIFYLLMGGSGVGFSVERQYTNELPTVAESLHETDTVIKVQDSRPGWAKSLKELIALLYNGDVPKWDVSRVRSAGTRLKTMGGRASGPKPLIKLFEYTIALFHKAKGRRLSSLECHDLICTIADTVIVGSVRRSACISFSNLTDDRLRRAKSGQWWLSNPERTLSNNSIMFTEKPDLESYTKEWRSIYKSKSGERGFVNQEALKRKAESTGRLDNFKGWFLLNPCGEAILRHTGGFCNLTEVIVRPNDTLPVLREKVRQATILGTLQSTLTDFKYLRKVWTDNTEEERLLGVSLTGIMDNDFMNGSCGEAELTGALTHLKQVAVETNKKWAKKLGVSPAKQLTLVKPSGTVSQLVDCSSGIHPRYSRYYIRTVAQDIKDPLSDLMINQKVPYETVGEKHYFRFPMESPRHAILQKDIDAISQLELWKIYRDHWCDGNPSQTIYYTDDTFLKVQDWVWDNWDSVGGLSFFPVSDHVYDNAPYKEISKEEYDEAVSNFPTNIDWGLLHEFEHNDNTESAQEFACSGGACDIT